MEDARKYSLKCPGCSTTYPPKGEHFICGRCGAPTVVAVNLAADIEFPSPNEHSMWRYFDLLPLEHRQFIVSQREGWTPLITPLRLAESLGIDALDTDFLGVRQVKISQQLIRVGQQIVPKPGVQYDFSDDAFDRFLCQRFLLKQK